MVERRHWPLIRCAAACFRGVFGQAGLPSKIVPFLLEPQTEWAGREARPGLVQYSDANMIVSRRKVCAGSLGSSLPMSWPVPKVARS